MDRDTVITIKLFLEAAKEFTNISDKLCDGWRFVEAEDLYKNYLRKETFIHTGGLLVKAEFIVFYNLSYGVPSFSFNMWNSTGALLLLEDIRKMAVTEWVSSKTHFAFLPEYYKILPMSPYDIASNTILITTLLIFIQDLQSRFFKGMYNEKERLTIVKYSKH